MGRVITVEDWAEIRRLYLAERMSIKAIAKKLCLARNTVRSAVRSVQPPRYVRAGSGSIVDEVEPRIRALLRDFPQMPATVIAERIGWDRSLTVLKERVRLLRPVYAPQDPSSRTTYDPGEVAQCDLWFPPAPIPLGYGQVGVGKTTPPVLVLTAGYSRFLAATMIPTRNAEDLVLGQWAVLEQLGGVPRLLVWDGEGGVGRYGGPNPKLTPQFAALRGMLGTRFYICKPNDPETKGLTERNNGFLETSFLPGRRFTGPADFNAQLAGFLARANARKRRALQGASAQDRIGADRAAMGPLPPIDPGDDRLAYDSDNRLADVRDALAGDVIAAGGPAGTPVACPAGSTGLPVSPVDTQICYDSSGRVATVVQPAPTSGAARPARTYTYATNRTDTAIAGFTPASGYAARTTYDTQGRIVQQNDSSGRTTTTVWGNATAPGNACTNPCGSDQPIVTATPDGEQTSTVYNTNGDATDVYGPAPLACFSGGWPSGITPTAPVQGYLPVANPQSTAGCGIAAVPHTHNGYDEGMTDLAASLWSNGQSAGPAGMHATGPGGTQPQSLCGATSGRLCAHWAAGAPPISSDASGHWSLRLTGTITLASAGAYTFGTASSQAITVSVDGTPQVHDGSDVSGFVAGRTRSTSGSAVQFAAGVHSIQVDFQGSATQLNEFAVSLTPDGGSAAVISTSILGPGYRLKTSTTDQDGIVTTTSYSDANLGPQYGLATASTVGAGTGAALTTNTSYEPPSTTTYLRKTGHTLPAGTATTYAYYTGTAGPLAAVCGVAATTPQGGQLQSQIDAVPASGVAAREQQFVYDAAGRRAGRRVGPSTSISSAPWQCTNYDAIGRITSQSWPAFNGAAARTVAYTYAVGGNPLVSSLTDTTGTVTSTVDLLGRLVGYTDTNGKTSTITYNQAGQLTATSGPQGSISNTYDPNSGSLATVTAGGSLLASTHYDTGSGRLTSVTYTNGTTATIGYDALGTQNSLVFTTTASGALVAGDQTTLSAARRVTGELEDINGTALTNPNPAGSTATTYTYDGAGRLATAYLPGASATYGYATNPAGDNCANPNLGANTNRTKVTITPTGGTASSTDYCYNGADQLVSVTTSAGTNTQYSYDTHGNQTNDHGTTLTWDGADRMTSATPAGGATTSYSYDALDRVVSHTTGTTTVRYAYAAYGDTPVAVLDSSNNVLQQLVSLPGGVLATIQTTGTVWSYPDLRGNMTVTTNNTGGRLNGPVTYDPWGQPTAGSQTLNNAAGGNTFAVYGANTKLTDTALGLTVLGARTYQPAEGRFLSVDPLEGGCANNYVYVFGDPLNKNDLTGQFCAVTIDSNPKHRGNIYVGAIGGVGGLGAGYGSVRAGHALFKGPGAMGWRATGAASGFGGFLGDFMVQYITTGKYNWCEGAIVAIGGFLIGAAFF